MCCSTVTNLLASWEVKQTTAPAANVYCKDVGQSWRRVPYLWKKRGNSYLPKWNLHFVSQAVPNTPGPDPAPTPPVPAAAGRGAAGGRRSVFALLGHPLPMAGDSGAGPGSSRPGQGSGEGGGRRPVLSALLELWAAPGSRVARVLQPRSPEKPSLHPPNLNNPQQPPRSSLESLPILEDWEDT